MSMRQRFAYFNPKTKTATRLLSEIEERIIDATDRVGDLGRPANASFRAEQAEDDTFAEIDLYDIIGWPFIDALQFKRTLNSITAPTIYVNINSPGGSVFDGFAMFADLINHPAKIVTRVNGLAASAASVVALAGDEIEIAENGFMMIHNAWSFAVGDKRSMRTEANLLDRIDRQLARTYSKRMSESVDEIGELMDSETWFDAEQAVEAGLADRITGAVDAQALSHDCSRFAKAPAEIKAKKPAPRQTKSKDDWSEFNTAALQLVEAMRA